MNERGKHSRIETIPIDPSKKYMFLIRGIDAEYARLLAQSIEEWLNKPSKVILVNIPPDVKVGLAGETIYLEKVGDDNEKHRSERERRDEEEPHTDD
jgi:hypothetical protein